MSASKFKYIKLLLSGILFGGAVSYFYQNDPNQASSHFLACPVKFFTGFDCPGCGSQRLIHNLLHLHIKAAFQDNALLFLSLPFVLYLLYIFWANSLFNTQYRIKLFYKNWFVWSLFALIISFGILRNLPFEPFCYLASGGGK